MSWTRTHIVVFLGIAAAAWSLVLFIQGTPLSREFFEPFGVVVTVLVIVGVFLENVAWRWPFLHDWFVQRPDLRGTWRVEIRSNWVDPATEQHVPPIEAYMAVSQTLSRLRMHLMTRESESWLIAERVTKSEKTEGYQIAVVYMNQPQLALRGVRSDIHYGAFVLETHGSSSRSPETMAGEYWTDRRTNGLMTLTNRVAKLYTRFDEAQASL
jgi:hypothetical protein